MIAPGRRAIFAVLIAVFLFPALFLTTMLFVPPFATTGERVPSATFGFLKSSGAIVWPGTTVKIKRIDDKRVLLERRWLVFWEARQPRKDDPFEGWIIDGEMTFGPAKMVQLVTLGVFSVLMATFYYASGNRKRHLLAQSNPAEPAVTI